MAELDAYHTQRNEDFENLMIDHLDGEIELYEQVCKLDLECLASL